MLILDILAIPFEFIKENLTGWVILVILVLILYFVGLRKYYSQKEKFYDQAMTMQNLEEIEDTEDTIKLSETRDHDDNDDNDDDNESISQSETKKQISKLNARDARKESKKALGVLKDSNRVDNNFNQNDSSISKKKSSRVTTANKDVKKDVTLDTKLTKAVEGFEDQNISDPLKSSRIPRLSSINIPTNQELQTATTLFDNLNLSDLQIQAAKNNYNDVISSIIMGLTKLNDMYSKNRYLNLKKQFDSILADGIDKIMNNLTLTIKSPRLLTRTAIRTEIMRTLNIVLEGLISKTNTELSNKLNKLAMQNSTTIDYNTQLSDVTEYRNKLEKYIAIDKLINNLGHNISVTDKEISNILDKSFILPLYERNFDRLSQLVKSDFNGDEGNLSMKYGKAYTDFLEQQKKEELNINPLELASRIESGVVSMLSNVGNSKNKSTKANEIKRAANITSDYGGTWYESEGELREQLTRDYGYVGDNLSKTVNNPIPQSQLRIIKDTVLDKDNIYSDPGNRGSYLINKKAQTDILEGFENNNDNKATKNIKPSITSPSLIKTFDDSNKKPAKNNSESGNEDITSKLLSGDFIQYMLDTINGYMTNGYDKYKQQINSYMGGMGGSDGANGSGFKLEENMIPAGFLLFILSLLIYFVDVTS
jgi:hypothetical protein